MEKYQNDFIKKIAASVQKYAPKYNILVNSPIIAQAILESAFGKSKLATDGFNYFGMKCGKSYTGEKITLNTREVIDGKMLLFPQTFASINQWPVVLRDILILLIPAVTKI